MTAIAIPSPLSPDDAARVLEQIAGRLTAQHPVSPTAKYARAQEIRDTAAALQAGAQAQRDAATGETFTVTAEQLVAAWWNVAGETTTSLRWDEVDPVLQDTYRDMAHAWLTEAAEIAYRARVDVPAPRPAQPPNLRAAH